MGAETAQQPNQDSAQDSTPLNARNATDIALDYLHAGLFEDAIGILLLTRGDDPLAHYFIGYAFATVGTIAGGAASISRRPPRCRRTTVSRSGSRACWRWRPRCEPTQPTPARPTTLAISGMRIAATPRRSSCWEQARELDPSFPTAHRNLGLAYFNKLHDPERARAAYERAFALNPGDARVLFELDQLERQLNRSPQQRLERLDQHRELVERRDDLTIEYITLLNLHGQHDAAHRMLLGRRFHPWEGGEGKTTGQYLASLVGQARALIVAGEYAPAVERLERALVYPHNLGEGKLPNAQENHVLYYLGLAYERGGDEATARAWFERAALGQSEPASAMYYNDQPPDMIFYQGLARRKLGQVDQARQIFQRLVDYGQGHLEDDVQMDYFAVSLPTFLVFDEDLSQRNRIHCHYMIGLGYLGLGQVAEAQQQFTAVLALDANSSGCAGTSPASASLT